MNLHGFPKDPATLGKEKGGLYLRKAASQGSVTNRERPYLFKYQLEEEEGSANVTISQTNKCKKGIFVARGSG